MNLRLRAFLLAASLSASSPALADYFADQHMYLGRVKTEYLAANEGTVANPITLGPGLYPCGTAQLIEQPCGPDPAPVTWPQSNDWAFNGAAAGGKYWVLLNNNEFWWTLPQNSGPPNQSMPRVAPGSGVFGFSMIPYTLGGKPAYQAHLVLNHNFPNPDGIPFLSIGADSDRGNVGPLGAFNDPARPNTVRFTAKIWDYYIGGGSGVFGFQLWSVATWGGKPRMLFLYLFTHEIGGEFISDQNHSRWNWRIAESSLSPGADVAYIDAALLPGLCGGVSAAPMTSLGEIKTYVINLELLYECASAAGLFDDPMPQIGAIPIDTIGFSNEAAGPGFALWTSVYDVRMQLGGSGCANCLSSSEPALVAGEPPVETTNPIRAALLASCRANEHCWRVSGPYVERGERPPVTRTPGRMIPYARWPMTQRGAR